VALGQMVESARSKKLVSGNGNSVFVFCVLSRLFGLFSLFGFSGLSGLFG
jgi:hypothetical protein